MDLRAVRLIAVDMDGTLLDSRHEVREDFFELYTRLQRAGVAFAAASGRQYDSILEKIGRVGPSLAVLGENGAYGKYRGEELVKTVLPKGALPEILARLADLPDVNAVLCGPHMAYVQSERDDFLAFMSEFYTAHQAVDDLAAVEDDIVKVALHHASDSESEIYPYFRDLEPGLKVKVSSKFWVDISHPDANKGHAMRLLQERLGVAPAETLAIGDYNNDLEMLAAAQYSYAMANAHPNVKAAAKYQTGSNDEGGVQAVLRAVLEAKGR